MGIYDMSGGVNEYVMGVIKDANGNLMSGYTSSLNSGFNGTLYSGGSYTDRIDFPDSKYYDVYNYNISDTNYSRRILGDATGEMGPFQSGKSSWYNDYAYFVDSSHPWFFRGGVYSVGSGAGAFYFLYNYGHAHSSISFRLVLGV